MIRLIKIIIKLGILFAILAWSLGVFLTPNDYGRCDLDNFDTVLCPKSQAIVVISGGDTKARTEHAAKLYLAGVAPKIIVAGAAFDESAPSNAAVMANIAKKAGVPARDIILEEKSRDTHQNAQLVKSILNNRSIHKITLVTSAYHQRRAQIAFKMANLASVEILNAPVLIDKDWSPTWWATSRGWSLAIRELGGILFTKTYEVK